MYVCMFKFVAMRLNWYNIKYLFGVAFKDLFTC